MQLRKAIELHLHGMRNDLAKKRRTVDRLMAECAALDDEVAALETILQYDLKFNPLDQGAFAHLSKDGTPQERGHHDQG